MRSFLFEQYGYYPTNFTENVFHINGWKFSLVALEDLSINIENIDKTIELIRENFPNKGAYIIRNRQNEIVSVYDNKKYLLVSVRLENVSYNELNKMHIIFKQDKQVLDMNNLLKAWETRLTIAEKDGISSLKVNDSQYSQNLEVAMFCLGMGQNALQYLSDIINDYGSELKDITVAHKRLVDLSSFDFFNPFNMVVDHPIRDYVELYRNDFLTFENLIDFLSYYDVDSKLASFFVARLMYPVNVIDVLEGAIYNKDKIVKLDYKIEKEIIKIKKIYHYFKDRFNIRPIFWMDRFV